MYPSTACRMLSMAIPLAHRAVEAVVVGLGAGGHLRFQHLHLVGAQELVDRILRVLEVPEHPGLGRTGLAAGGGEPLRDPVVAEAALVDRLGAGVDEAAAVGAGPDPGAGARGVRTVPE